MKEDLAKRMIASALAEGSGQKDLTAYDCLPVDDLMPTYNEMPSEFGSHSLRLNLTSELTDRICAKGWGERICVHFDGEHISYNEMQLVTDRIVQLLGEELGVVSGNRVLLVGGNSPMWIATFLAILKLGAIAVPILKTATQSEITEILKVAQPTAAVIDESCLDARSAFKAWRGLEHSAAFFNPKFSGVGDLNARIQTKLGQCEPANTSKRTIACLMFTSGSTGKPKGVVHYHGDLLAHPDIFGPYVTQPQPEDVFGGTPSFAFLYGLMNLLITPLRYGASLAIFDQGYPQKLLSLIEEESVTIVISVPKVYRSIIPIAEHYELGSIRISISSGEILAEDTRLEWSRITNNPVIDGFGTSELATTFMISFHPHDADSIGRPLPGYSLKLLPIDNSQVGTGRLFVRGPTGCKYYDNPSAQQRSVVDGWTSTGDIFSVDGQGNYRHISRADDIINIDGFNVSPQEVEAALGVHAAVNDCVVYKNPDDSKLAALIVLHSNGADQKEILVSIKQWCAEKLSAHKRPQEFKFVPSVPRTANGKLQRFRIHDFCEGTSE